MVLTVRLHEKPEFALFPTPEPPPRLFDEEFRIVTDGEDMTAGEIAQELPRVGSMHRNPKRNAIVHSVRVQQYKQRQFWGAVVTYEKRSEA